MGNRHTVGMFGQKVPMGQANGPDVDLIVSGTELYATYETPDGFPAIYDDALGLFCYARLADGRFESTGVSVAQPPPPGVELHAAESDAVKQRKIQERMRQMDRNARPGQREEQ
jgi:hypothetical protein